MCLGGFAGREAPNSPLPAPGAASPGTTALPLEALTLTGCLPSARSLRRPFPGTPARGPAPSPAAASAPAPARRRLMSAAPTPRPRHTPGEPAVQRPRGGRPGAPVASAAAQRGDSASRNVGVLHGSALKAF